MLELLSSMPTWGGVRAITHFVVVAPPARAPLVAALAGPHIFPDHTDFSRGPFGRKRRPLFVAGWRGPSCESSLRTRTANLGPYVKYPNVTFHIFISCIRLWYLGAGFPPAPRGCRPSPGLLPFRPEVLLLGLLPFLPGVYPGLPPGTAHYDQEMKYFAAVS